MCARSVFRILVRLRQVLARRPFALVEIRDRVEAEGVDAHVHPEVEDLDERVVDGGIVEIEVGLMGEEAVPVIRLGHRVPRPVRRLVSP